VSVCVSVAVCVGASGVWVTVSPCVCRFACVGAYALASPCVSVRFGVRIGHGWRVPSVRRMRERVGASVSVSL